MTEERTKEKLLEKEHDHHNPTAATMTNHIVANQRIVYIKLHQYH